MLKTFAMRGREVPLTIYGPPGLRGLMSDLRRVYGRLTYEVRLSELRPATRSRWAAGGSAPTAWSTGSRRSGTRWWRTSGRGGSTPAWPSGWACPPGPQFGRLQRASRSRPAGGSEPRDVMGESRPGRTLVFTGDTEPCEATVAVAQGADLLVHDGTFADEETERARKTGHSTARQAAEVAEADVSLLALTHLSSRYFAPTIEKEAREVFERTVVPRDFDLIEVPYRERGRASPGEMEGVARAQPRAGGARPAGALRAAAPAASAPVATLAASVPLTRSREARKDLA